MRATDGAAGHYSLQRQRIEQTRLNQQLLDGRIHIQSELAKIAQLSHLDRQLLAGAEGRQGCGTLLRAREHD